VVRVRAQHHADIARALRDLLARDPEKLRALVQEAYREALAQVLELLRKTGLGKARMKLCETS